mmetsp:Transcript_20503/g.56909  ORF Transcript_20503/g.56909 Transcript_20503/m.56909 type:complete len:332 (+) Transcript_20503:404-1399(+)
MLMPSRPLSLRRTVTRICKRRLNESFNRFCVLINSISNSESPRWSFTATMRSPLRTQSCGLAQFQTITGPAVIRLMRRVSASCFTTSTPNSFAPFSMTTSKSYACELDWSMEGTQSGNSPRASRKAVIASAANRISASTKSSSDTRRPRRIDKDLLRRRGSELSRERPWISDATAVPPSASFRDSAGRRHVGHRVSSRIVAAQSSKQWAWNLCSHLGRGRTSWPVSMSSWQTTHVFSLGDTVNGLAAGLYSHGGHVSPRLDDAPGRDENAGPATSRTPSAEPAAPTSESCPSRTTGLGTTALRGAQRNCRRPRIELLVCKPKMPMREAWKP